MSQPAGLTTPSAYRTGSRRRTAAGPSSLLKLSDAERPRCPGCGSDRAVRLKLTLHDASPVTLTNCHVCEQRTWTRGGRPVTAEMIIGLATAPGGTAPRRGGRPRR